MSLIELRPADEVRYDVVSLGEVMLRLDPGEGRIRTTRQFRASEGGGEYNVARGMRKAFEKRSAVVTALVKDEVGRLVEDMILTGGVDTQWIKWVESDGYGGAARNGLNFTERGFGIRGAVGTSDRGHTAVSQMRPEDIDWDKLFGEYGSRWLHTGGIFAALSEQSAETARQRWRPQRSMAPSFPTISTTVHRCGRRTEASKSAAASTVSSLSTLT